MERLPHEIVALIGDWLLPHWRCRLFLTSKYWYNNCYLQYKELFKWCSRNSEITPHIKIITYDTGMYKRIIENNNVKHEYTNLIIPHWNNKRINIRRYYYGTLMIVSLNYAFHDSLNNSIITDEYPYRNVGFFNRPTSTRWRCYALYYEFGKYIIRYDKSNSSIICRNIDNITKYLNLYDIYRLWVSLGFYYYRTLCCDNKRIRKLIKNQRKLYREIKKKTL